MGSMSLSVFQDCKSEDHGCEPPFSSPQAPGGLTAWAALQLCHPHTAITTPLPPNLPPPLVLASLAPPVTEGSWK